MRLEPLARHRAQRHTVLGLRRRSRGWSRSRPPPQTVTRRPQGPPNGPHQRRERSACAPELREQRAPPRKYTARRTDRNYRQNWRGGLTRFQCLRSEKCHVEKIPYSPCRTRHRHAAPPARRRERMLRREQTPPRHSVCYAFTRGDARPLRSVDRFIDWIRHAPANFPRQITRSQA